MTNESKARFRWAVGAVLSIVGISGIPGDVSTWLDWLDGIRKAMSYGIVRLLSVPVFLVCFFMAAYTSGIRRWIISRFRLGQIVNSAAFDKPLADKGWKFKEGSTQPVLIEMHQPAIGPVTQIEAHNGFVDMEYAFRDVDPSGLLVHIRADVIGTRRLDPFWGPCWGMHPQVFFKVRRKADAKELVGSASLNSHVAKPYRHDSHDWMYDAQPYRDHQGYENVVFDMRRLIAREYTPAMYDFLGITAVRLSIAQAKITPIRVHQAGSPRHWWRVFWDLTTWFPWTS